MIPHNPLQPLHDLDKTSPQFHHQLIDFLRGDEYQDVVPTLQTEDLTWLVEYLDNVLSGISDPTSPAFQKPIHELRKICGIMELLPTSYTLSDSLLDAGLPSASGCVREGTVNGSRVHIKRVSMHRAGDMQKVKKTFYQVAVVWKHLAHPNIAPFLGVTTDPIQLISVWMLGGDLAEYIADNSDADRPSLLSDVAEGLNYLHSCNVIHENLKGSNVLVDAAGHARLTDFGLSAVTQNLYAIRNASDEHDHSVRWIAPEILDDRGTYSKEADVFSFAMVTIEAFTGAVPFSDKSHRATVLAIVGGERPPRPDHPTLTDGLWTLTQQCWDQEVRRRPQVSQILRDLGPAWKRLVDRPLNTNERISLITDIFSDRDETEMVKRLCKEDAQSFVDIVDEMLGSLTSQLRKKCLSALCKICGRHGLLPRSLHIPICYNRSEDPLRGGGYADVWMGEHQGCKVAVKVLRVYSTSNLGKVISRFCKEVVTWKSLSHPNVLPLLGVTMSDSRFAMVSEWMINENINKFVKANRDANRFELLGDVARGLIYMHGEGMIHGDLKGANILIDRDGHARLADFGLLTIVSDSTNPTTSSSSGNAGTKRWMSPELLDPELFGFKNGRPTKESDCYAFGMVILEVLTGQAPFLPCTGFVVMRKVVDGERPGRPQGPEAVWFTDDLWETLGKCWSPQPKVRPSVEVVLKCLERGSAAWQPLPPVTVDDIQSDNDELVFTSGPYIVADESGVGGTICGQEPSQQREDSAVTSPGFIPAIPRMYSRKLTHPSVPVPPATSDTSASVSDIQQRLERLDPTDANYQRLLLGLLSHQGLRKYIQSLQEHDLKGFVELLDKALDHIPETNDLSRKTLRRLQSTCSNCGVLPQSYLIPNGSLSKKGDAIAAGAFANAHKAELDGKKVCIKALRSYIQDPGGFTKKTFYREVVVWKRLQHPNIVPFLGVPNKIPPPFEIVYEWMEDGKITEYVKKNPKVDLINLLWDVADGLHYLHSRNVIHGDLKGANILIDKDGHARLTDFGLASVIRGEYSIYSPQESTATTTTTWAAPEILGGGPATKEGDVFTFGMVTVETFTGRSPFANFQLGVFNIVSGKRPKRPDMLRHDRLWEIVEMCWNQEPKKRPTIPQLLEFFQMSFPKERGTPAAQQPHSNASSTWTLVIANKVHIGANTETSRAPPRKDTEDGDGPQDPSPEVPQIDRHRPARDSQLGKRKLPTTKIVPTPAESREPKLPVPTDMHEPTGSTQDKTAPKANTSPKTEDKPSLLGRVRRKSKKFMKKLLSRN